MTVYVDTLFTATSQNAQAARHGTRWCHMFTDADDLAELHALATKLGLRPYFQNHATLPHYDLTPKKRAQAIALGAVAVSDEENKTLLVAQVAKRKERLKMATYQDYVQAVETDWLNAQRGGNRTEELLFAAVLFRLAPSPKLAVTWLTELVEKTNDSVVRARYARVLTDVQVFAAEGETHE